MKKIAYFLMLSFGTLFSQNEKNKNDTGESQSKIRVYSPTTTSNATYDTYKWVVKTDIIGYISGEFPVIGEYRFADKFSAEASLGLTYNFYSNGSFLEFDEDSYFETNAALGSSFRFGVKYYPSSDYDPIEGWAFGLQLFTRKNNREYNEDEFVSSGIEYVDRMDEKRKSGINLTISRQMFIDSNICFEMILGIGIAKTKREYLEYDYNNSIAYPETEEKTIPNFTLGYRMGFGN